MSIPRPDTALRAVFDELLRRDGLFTTRVELGRRCAMSDAQAGRCLRILRDRGLITLRTKRGCRGWCIAEVVPVSPSRSPEGDAQAPGREDPAALRPDA